MQATSTKSARRWPHGIERRLSHTVTTHESGALGPRFFVAGIVGAGVTPERGSFTLFRRRALVRDRIREFEHDSRVWIFWCQILFWRHCDVNPVRARDSRA